MTIFWAVHEATVRRLSLLVVYRYCACWYDPDPIQGQGHGASKFPKLWLSLQVCRKKPCVMAAMTVSPLAGLFITVGINSVIPLECTLRTRNLPQNSRQRRTTVDGTARHINLILATHSLTHAVTTWRSTTESRYTRPSILGRVECTKTASTQTGECFESSTVLWAFHTIQPSSIVSWDTEIDKLVQIFHFLIQPVFDVLVRIYLRNVTRHEHIIQ